MASATVAMVAAMRMRPAMMHDALLDDDAVSVAPGRKRRDGEEDGVHDGKRP